MLLRRVLAATGAAVLSAGFGDARIGQRISGLIAGVASVAFDPVPVYLMAFGVG